MTSIEIAHQQFGHLDKKRLIHVQKMIEDMTIESDEFPKNCTICIQAKKMKIQNHKIVMRASKSADQFYMNY